ncbi:MAG TPA: protein phosphatase 2C domain-containing protein [Mucilaginibacter sp.]|nr:protein phosphatase 2C domain-containing protein [Mucilaginibacter sp.]
MTDQYFGITDTGKERKNNEDAFIARQGPDDRFIIACVIDGVGGYAGGEIAASLAREAILQRLEKPSGDIISMIIDCLGLANERIVQEKQQNRQYEMMSCVTTLAIADVKNNQFYYAHVGDTRLYLLRDNSLVKISHDQSFVGFLEESGRLSEKDAMSHPKRNEINKALGFEADLLKNTEYIETGQSPFLSGDMLLLCSDGLTDMVGSEEITSILTNSEPLKEKGRKLVAAANRQGGKDNITVVLVHNNKTPQQRPATAVKQRQPLANPVAAETRKTEEDEEPAPVIIKKNVGVIAALSVLLLVFIGISAFLYLRKPAATILPETAQEVTTDTTITKTPGALQIKLQRAIDSLKTNTLILSDTEYKAPVVLTEAIKVNRDTLLLKAEGRIEFLADTSYHGPAFLFSSKNKEAALDSVNFNGFNAAIQLNGGALLLKHVRFIHCKNGIHNQTIIPDTQFYSLKYPAMELKPDTLPVVKK